MLGKDSPRHVEHPLVRPETVEFRLYLYQKTIKPGEIGRAGMARTTPVEMEPLGFGSLLRKLGVVHEKT